MAVNSTDGYIGYYAGSKGTATVDGTGSTWTNSGGLDVGYSGGGTLNITNGGAVLVAGTTYVGFDVGSTGTINFGANGGTLTTASLAASPAQLTGTGTVNARGLVSDIDLMFDSTHGLRQSLTFSGLSDQNVTVNLDMTGGSSTNGALGAGWKGTGSLTVRNGIVAASTYGYIGYYSGSKGMATVDGIGSTWTNSNNLYAGYSGSGMLAITNGGSITSLSNCYIGCNSNSTGVVTVNGSGSKGTAGSQVFVGYAGNGTLSIVNGGTVVSNAYNNSLFSSIGYYSGSTGAVMVDGAGSKWTINLANLTIGDSGSGTLSITNGGAVSNSFGAIGYYSGSTGAVTVSGTGSTWTNSQIDVGLGGTGTLNITNGGTVVSDFSSEIGFVNTGVATVNGANSTWTTFGGLSVGSPGTATLSISGGGAVTAMDVSINSTSLLAIDVGRGSSLVVSVSGSAGTISNSGTVRILAGAGVAAGNTYSPISAAAWTGSGAYQALGGTWNSTNHQFTVSSAATGTSGSPVTIDLASQQRMLIGDTSTSWTVGESFLATTSSTMLTSTASAISGGTLTSLSASLGTGQTVLSGWNLSASSAYAAGTPVYLSFGVGAAQFLDDLQIWQYSGTWSQYAADRPDLRSHLCEPDRHQFGRLRRHGRPGAHGRCQPRRHH